MLEFLNFSIKKSSEIKPFIIFKPCSVSSVIERNSACSFCTRVEVAFKERPISEITNHDSGINIKTKAVSLKLIKNMAVIVKKIVNGSLTINSSIDKKEC